MEYLLKYSLFEENINKYYFSITDEEFCDVKQNMDLCTFDEKEIAVIEPLIPNDRVIDKKTLGIKNLDFYVGGRKSRIPSNFKFDQYIKIDINFRGSKSNDFLSISKSNDEWYYILYYFKFKTNNSNYKELFFKCDQLDGLEIFLKDFFSNKIAFSFLNENIFESSENKDYYKIEDEVYKNDIRNGVIRSLGRNKFTNKDIEKIKSAIPKNDFCNILPLMIKFSLPENREITITKENDEWYYLSYYHMGPRHMEMDFYKCDQLEGLLSLINDIYYY